MKKGLTHIIFVIDRSGSMESIASDMIGGYNKFIKTQKETPGECFVSFYQFDDIYEAVFERVPLQDVKELTDKTYVPRNSTALYDAMGKTITNYGLYLASISEDERPDRVLFVTITDGMNNASVNYTAQQVNEMITHQREVYKWDFVFLGSNIDSWDTGASMGIAAGTTLQYANTKGSVSGAFDSLSRNTRMYRCSAAPEAYAFKSDDYAVQDQFLDGDLKSKNKKQQKSSPTATTKKT